jgi:hypothetical protein
MADIWLMHFIFTKSIFIALAAERQIPELLFGTSLVGFSTGTRLSRAFLFFFCGFIQSFKSIVGIVSGRVYDLFNPHQDNIKMDRRKVWCINFSRSRDQWRTSLNTVLNVRFHERRGFFSWLAKRMNILNKYPAQRRLLRLCYFLIPISVCFKLHVFNLWPPRLSSG